jgi:hypothetical protein
VRGAARRSRKARAARPHRARALHAGVASTRQAIRSTAMALSDVLAIDDVRPRPYRLPTDRPDADGTYAWHAPTIVVGEVDAKPVTGLGYTYTDASAAPLDGRLARRTHPRVQDRDRRTGCARSIARATHMRAHGGGRRARSAARRAPGRSIFEESRHGSVHSPPDAHVPALRGLRAAGRGRCRAAGVGGSRFLDPRRGNTCHGDTCASEPRAITRMTVSCDLEVPSRSGKRKRRADHRSCCAVGADAAT